MTVTVTKTFNSCIYYPPEELTYVNPHSSPPNINILSLNLARDTIYLWTTTRFDFDMTTDGQPVTGVKISYMDRSFMYYNSAGIYFGGEFNQPSYLHMQENKDIYLTDEEHRKISINWSGIRCGLNCSLRLATLNHR